MSIILDSPQVVVSLGVASGVPLSPILENPGVTEAAALANAADQTNLNNAEHAKLKDAGPRKPRSRGRGQQRRTSLEATTGPMNVPRFGASMRLPSTIKEEGVVKMEAAKARKEDGDAAKSQQDDGVAVEPEQNIKLVEGENSDNMSNTNKKRASKNSKNSKQARSSDQLNPTEDAEDVSKAKKQSTSKRRQYTRKSKPKDKGGKDEVAVERAGTALGRAVAEVVKNARGAPAADGGGKGNAVADGHPSAGGDAGAADAVGRPRAEGGEAGRGSAMAGGREEDAGTKAAVDSEGAVEAVARRVESAVDAHTGVGPAPTEATTVTPEVAAGTAEAGAGSIEVDAARTQVDGRPVEVDTEAKVKSKSKPRPRRNNRKGGKSKKRSVTEEAETVAGTKAAPVEAGGGAPVEADGGASTGGGGEVSAVGSEGGPPTADGGQQAQTREDSMGSGGEQANGAPVDVADNVAGAAQGKKSGNRRRFWKGRAKRGGRQAEKKVAGEPADGGPAPAEEGKAASVDSGAAPSADPTATALDARTAALAHDGATDSVRGPFVDASKLSRSGTPSGTSQARRRRRTPARGGRARGGRARENAAAADAAGESAGAHDEGIRTAPVVSDVDTPVAGQVAAFSVSGTNDAFVVTRTVDIGADVPVPVVLLAVT
ncbi:uncharacterized protein SCHCODRAFT_02620522 [Schizophyllum commune H4-8]|nr:uncharacterized protein SCHCODRAFT_02620522 [Schizophyllum commune H4-8]KAI5895893.1 hypothetical protein SCHCODRAFT_02620522 [Schizophyllum commune H4-8]